MKKIEKNILFILILILSLINYSYAYTYNVYSQNEDWSEYSILDSQVVGTSVILNSLIQNSSEENNHLTYSTSTQGYKFFFFKPKDENKMLYISYWNSNYDETLDLNFSTYKKDNTITSNKCEINNVIKINNSKYTIRNNLNTYMLRRGTAEYELINSSLIPNFDKILKENYYMKAYVVMDIIDNLGHVIKYILPNEIENDTYRYQDTDLISPHPRTPYRWYSQKINLEEGTNYNAKSIGEIPYVILKPGKTNVTFNLSKINFSNPCETYKTRVYVYPIDGKCDQSIGDEDLNVTSKNSLDSPIFDSSIPDYLLEKDFKITQIPSSFPMYERNDNFTIGKISCEKCSNSCYLNTPTQIPIIIPNQNLTNYKTIKTFKQNILIKNEKVNPLKIALYTHTIKRFNKINLATKFLNNTFNLMEQYNIEKYYNYNLTTNKTTIKIKLKDGPSLNNLVLYQIIPKIELPTFKKLKILNNGGGKFFINDKDPVIGWEFDSSNGTEEIEYEIPGNSSGTTVILTEDPILFNEGNLIINYRETGCNPKEVHLFDLSNLENSNILNKNTGTFQICIAHLNDSINLFNNNINPNNLDIFSYNSNSVMSSNTSELTNKMSISTDKQKLIWTLKIQKENPGDFSCLGSSKILNGNSQFGDCIYNESNRFWIKLDLDEMAPITTLSSPYISHKLEVNLIAKDNVGGSGVKNLSYKIDNEPWTTINQDNKKLLITCPNDWGCTKKIQFFACDNAKNCEVIKNETLNIIDKGSSCKSDCMGRPSPDRYLKGCRNLNGCKYYPINSSGINDDGIYVAKQCNFMLEDSWVKYDETHEIKCPKGPIRKSANTNKRLDIMFSKCENIIKIPYNVILNGENIIMNIITCHNPYNKEKEN